MKSNSIFDTVGLVLFFSAAAIAQPVTFTTQEDHRNMMEQLGITSLRPGASGNEQDANHANYDEALANPYPLLPEVLKLRNGEAVTSPAMWWEKRRPEIIEDFEREVLGRVPFDVPPVRWEVVQTREALVSKKAVVEKLFVGRVDNAACPSIEVNISMSLTVPKDATGPVPVLMMYGRPSFDIPRPGLAPNNTTNPPTVPRAFIIGANNPDRLEKLLTAGWGYSLISPTSIQADNGAGLTRGIIGLSNRGQPRRPEDWGALRAWAWGASQGLEYLLTNSSVDKSKIGIEGVSRYGKAALVAMAFDQRFAVALIGSSGEGGAKLHRRNFGEAVENLAGSGEYHWMAGNFLKYAAAESSFGSLNADDIPVDAHQLIALCAPRLTFISYGIPERGDAKWLDQQGSFMAAVAAGPTFRLLGAKDLGRSDDYNAEKMPEVNFGLLDGQLAWRQHDGGHTDGPNIEYFLKWANSHFEGQSSFNTDTLN